MRQLTPDDAKLRELVLHIAARSWDDEHFGAVKLQKLLFHVDFLAYARRGVSITSQEYQRLPQGPAVRRFVPLRDEWLEAGDAAEWTRRVGAFEQRRLVPCRDAHLSLFSAAEIALVDEVLTELRDLSARTVSDLSHRLLGWKAAAENETIPYETVFLSSRELTAAESAFAETVVANRGR